MSGKKTIRVREVMKTEFDVVDGMSTVKAALASMKHVDPKCLVVRKRHADDECGLLLVSDIGRHVLAKDRAADRVNVYEIMAKPVVMVRPEMDIRYCARLFNEFHLSRAPVIENGEVIGIVSFTDLVLRGMQEQ
jgi:CBS domain-containing protein